MSRSWRLLILFSILLLVAGCRRDRATETALSTQDEIGRPTPEVTALADAPGGSSNPTIVATNQPGPPTSIPLPSVGRVTLWHSWSGADGDALVENLERFLTRNPGIGVETLFVAYNDLPQSYADAVASGGGPDLILAPSWDLRDLTAVDALLPIDELLSTEERADYNPAALENLSTGGRLYGLPTNYELVALYVNSDLAAPAGVPATLDAWLSQAAGDPALGIGLYLTFYHVYWGIPGFGSSLFDSAGRVVLDETAGTALFLDWLGRARAIEGTYVSSDYGMVVDRFKGGEFAYFVDGPWAIADLAAALGDALVVTTLPAGPAGPARPLLNADGFLFNPTMDTSQRGLAFHLARFLTDAESASRMATLARRIPAHRGADVGGDRLLLGFMRQAATATAEPHRPEIDQVWGYGGDMLVKVLDGGMPAQEAVGEAAALINEANGE